MSSHSFLCHSAASLLLKCANNECLNLGVQSTVNQLCFLCLFVANYLISTSPAAAWLVVLCAANSALDHVPVVNRACLSLFAHHRCRSLHLLQPPEQLMSSAPVRRQFVRSPTAVALVCIRAQSALQ